MKADDLGVLCTFEELDHIQHLDVSQVLVLKCLLLLKLLDSPLNDLVLHVADSIVSESVFGLVKRRHFYSLHFLIALVDLKHVGEIPALLGGFVVLSSSESILFDFCLDFELVVYRSLV